MEIGKKWKKRDAGASLAATVLAMSVCTAYAADGSQSQSMQLTIQKNASYTMSIPASQDITFGTVDTEIGSLSVTGEIGTKQEVRVSVDTTEFTDTADDGNRFPFALWQGGTAFTGKNWSSKELENGGTSVSLTVHIPSETWGKTSPGTYRALVTFAAELADTQ